MCLSREILDAKISNFLSILYILFSTIIYEIFLSTGVLEYQS